MPVRHFDEIGELYSNNIKPVTDEQILSEETVGSLPQDGFAHANKKIATDKAFNDAGPEAAENFEASPNDTNKKKSKKSAYNEEKLSNPVVHEKKNLKEVSAKDKEGKKLLKGKNDPTVAKEGIMDAAKSVVTAPWEVVKGVGKAVAAVPVGMAKSAGKLAVAPAQALGYEKPEAAVNASAKPGKRIKKVKESGKRLAREINNSTMKENNNKSTFDRLFEDVMGEDFEEFGDDAGVEIGGVEGEEGIEDEISDTVTLELPRDLAEGLHEALMDQLGGGDEPEDSLEDLGDIDELEGESVEESHVELQAAPEAGHLMGKANKAALSTDGGSASTDTGGQEDGGKPKAAKDGVGTLTGKSNKAGNVKGGNAFSH
jgi:hypothetical protein